MSIPAYSLHRTSTRIEKDGSRCYITLHSNETGDRSFRADLEGLSAHVILLQQVCAEMSAQLTQSGKAPAMQPKTGTEPMRALSFQLVPFEDKRTASLRVHTEAGTLVNLELPAGLLQMLRTRIDDVGHLNAD